MGHMIKGFAGLGFHHPCARRVPGVLARNLLFIGLILAGAAVLLGAIRRRPAPLKAGSGVPSAGSISSTEKSDVSEVVARVNAAFRTDWAAERLAPAARADDLAIARRISLGLAGRIPSLEEIRLLEEVPAENRIANWVEALLNERSTADYLAERLARTYIGVEDGPFLVFRRRRFVSWLADQLAGNRPYDQLVRELIVSEGLWTDSPATNFVTVTLVDGAQRPNSSRLAGRVARAFLGARIDCAECHDHPFDHWKQRDFAGLAAYFDQTRQTFTGIRDQSDTARSPADEKQISPAVPFQAELLGHSGHRRQQLADWETSRQNQRFSRAIVNRVWGILCGQPLVTPVDNMPDEGLPPAIDLLADDFVANGFDLRRLIRAITETEVYSLASQSPDEAAVTARSIETWAIFPLTRLRPEQTVGAIFQARSLETVDRQTPLFLRFVQFIGKKEFVDRNGDLGEDEFAPQSGTIPQRLLLMNGKEVREATDESNFVNASNRIAQLAPDDDKAIEIAYLTILTRRPTSVEMSYFHQQLEPLRDKERARRIEDLCWTLLNSMEFCWNH